MNKAGVMGEQYSMKAALWLMRLGGGALICFLAADLMSSRRENEALVKLPKRPDRSFASRIELRDLVYQQSSGMMQGQLFVEMTARQAELDINHVTLSLTENGDIRHFEGDEIEQYEIRGEDQLFYSHAEINTPVEIPATPARSDIWYPFDVRSFTLLPLGCVNASEEEGFLCSAPENLEISEIRSRVSAPGFTVECIDKTDKVVVVFRRNLFIRVIAVAFFVVAVLFFSFLLWPSKASPAANINDLLGKSLGFLGTLWGIRLLLVPASVGIFPTVVDYTVLMLFFAVFFIIVTRAGRLYSNPKPQEEKPWDD